MCSWESYLTSLNLVNEMELVYDNTEFMGLIKQDCKSSAYHNVWHAGHTLQVLVLSLLLISS